MENEHFIDDKFSIDQLIKRSWDHKTSEEFIKFLNFMASLTHYSYYNKLLVYTQNKAVTFFGGTSFWKKKFARTINENARPHVILVPKGPVMMVYDIFDTSGKESPEEFLEKGLGKPLEVKGMLKQKTLDFAIQVAKDYGIKIKFEPLSYLNAGYVSVQGNVDIALKEGMSIEQSFSFFIHELAHLLLGHTKHETLTNTHTNKQIKLIHRELPKSVRELEAETIRYLICYKLRLETRSAEYMANYINSPNDLFQFSYENVIKVADKIEKVFIDD